MAKTRTKRCEIGGLPAIDKGDLRKKEGKKDSSKQWDEPFFFSLVSNSIAGGDFER